jgi:DNA-binding IscR family transcriptional regulator
MVACGMKLGPFDRPYMESEYSGFLEANPTFQERVEAFTSGLLTPDPKAVVLWSMEQGVSYTIGELNRQVKEFVGDRLPISYAAMWSYCRGSGQWPGALEKFGFVANETDGVASGPFAFAKTSAGADFGDAIAARALWLCGKLTSKYRSMLRIFGSPQRSSTAKTRRGFAVYRVVKLLAEQPDQVYRTTDVADLTSISMDVLSLALNTMGQAGVIDYEAPQRDKNGQTTTGWAQYRLLNKDLLTKDMDELYREFRRDRPGIYLKAYLRSVIDYIRDQPEAAYSADTLPHVVAVSSSYVSNVLSFLKRAGFLESDFTGGVILSRAMANQNTGLLWEHLLEPIEAVAQRLDPTDCRGFCDMLDSYESHSETRMDHVQRMLAQYQMERVHKGLEKAQDIDTALLTLPGRVMKLSAILERVNRARESSLSSRTVCAHLDGLVRSGRFERPKKGHYKRL